MMIYLKEDYIMKTNMSMPTNSLHPDSSALSAGAAAQLILIKYGMNV